MKYWDKAWSLVKGCTPVSKACDNCWLAAIEYRFYGESGHPCIMSNSEEEWESEIDLVDNNRKFNGTILLCPDLLNMPLKIRKPTTFAIWSDLFHESVTDEFIDKAFEIINLCCQHTFLICTKRPERMAAWINREENFKFLASTHKIYLGTTAENQEMADKHIPELLKCEPFKLFLSVEPMLGPINLENICIETEKGDIRPWLDISQIICGCESGWHVRETKEEWVKNLKDQCLAAGVPLWVKQLKVNGKMVYNHELSIINLEDLWKH